MIRVNLLSCRCGCGSHTVGPLGWKRGHSSTVTKRGNNFGSANRGKTRPRISLAKLRNTSGRGNKGKFRTDEHRQKIREKLQGRKQDPNAVLKRTISLRGGLSDVEYEIKKKSVYVWRSLLGRAINQLSWVKNRSTIDELGYMASDLRLHIEKQFVDGMSWENHGRGQDRWHVDHIRPVNSFPVGTHPSVVNALSNLRPLWEKQNLTRAKKWKAK